MIHERKWESVHNFFFMRLAQIVPALTTSKKAIFVTDEEKSIVNSVKNYFPEIPRFRCWLHALANIKRKLTNLGIREKIERKKYKDDFLRLLNQDSESNYKSVLAEFYLKKWDKVRRLFTFYFVFVNYKLFFTLYRNLQSILMQALTMICIIWDLGCLLHSV